jgi:hypothetical protein
MWLIMLGRNYWGHSVFSSQIAPWQVNATDAAIDGLPSLLAAVGAYAVLASLTRRRTRANDTLCRKCGYILRGISEPRWPECGERI